MYTRPEGRVYLSSRVTGRGSRSAMANSSKIVSLGCIGPDLVGPGAASAGACIQVNSGAAPAQRVQGLDAAMTGRLRCARPTAALGDQCRVRRQKGFDTQNPGGYSLGLLAGGVPERSKGSDCKSDGTAFEGSNPSPSTSGFLRCGLAVAQGCGESSAWRAGVAQW